ncbi:MAG: fibrobacter succinogenes major paralogous domain-containing protein [Candidatus Delongbacteria bacterium]|nr:fibrobacter succinogenes major paralogous domain-containing protein [Candidatus Delongbacteria bacterium]
MVLKQEQNMKNIINITIVSIIILLLVNCTNEDITVEPDPFVDHTGEVGSVTDIDGNVYATIGIGSQIWMAENLKVTHYRNGDPVPNLTDNTEWSNTTDGAYCYYNNDPNLAEVYGLLYNWYAVKDNRNIAPEGWHVPTEEEWDILINWLGGEEIAGSKLKESGNAHWISNSDADNESGFTGLPGGMKLGIYYINLYNQGVFRTSSYWNIGGQYWPVNYSLHCDSINCDTYTLPYKEMGVSVRCVKD